MNIKTKNLSSSKGVFYTGFVVVFEANMRYDRYIFIG
jgi:hypothetical protein